MKVTLSAIRRDKRLGQLGGANMDEHNPEFDSPEARANFATRHIWNLSERKRRRDELMEQFQKDETAQGLRPDYFSPPPSAEEAVMRGIKGNTRKAMVLENLKKGGLKSIPEAWLAHNLSETLKDFLQSQHPQARGGEDLADLVDGEVEIARMTLLDSVHGEVTSLRARLDESTRKIHVRLIDEYETEYEIRQDTYSWPLAVHEVLELFRDADPSPTATTCKTGFSSAFYPSIDAIANSMNLRRE